MALDCGYAVEEAARRLHPPTARRRKGGPRRRKRPGATRTHARRRGCDHHRSMIRVLVVDDHPVLRAGLEAVLRAEPGFVCVGVAADGAEMQRVMHRTAPDVIVLDRRLGDEDGRALCAPLRSDDNAPEVVIYTADGSADMNRRARAAGACSAVAKERDVSELFDALRLAGRRRGEVGAPGGPA